MPQKLGSSYLRVLVLVCLLRNKSAESEKNQACLTEKGIRKWLVSEVGNSSPKIDVICLSVILAAKSLILKQSYPHSLVLISHLGHIFADGRALHNKFVDQKKLFILKGRDASVMCDMANFSCPQISWNLIYSPQFVLSQGGRDFFYQNHVLTWLWDNR